MLGIPKVMIFLFIVLSSLMYWTTSNVCRYNFAIEKRTNILNILTDQIDPSIPKANVIISRSLIVTKLIYHGIIKGLSKI